MKLKLKLQHFAQVKIQSMYICACLVVVMFESPDNHRVRFHKCLSSGRTSQHGCHTASPPQPPSSPPKMPPQSSHMGAHVDELVLSLKLNDFLLMCHNVNILNIIDGGKSVRFRQLK